MLENKELSHEAKLICFLLESSFMRMKSLEEKVECILHTICKNNDEKTGEAISKFLGSGFRNRMK